MIGVDTNVLLRALLEDDPVQSPKALALLKSDRIYIPLSVMLELEWALRNVFAKPRKQVHGILSQILDLENAIVGCADAIAVALRETAERGDFADFLHWALSENCDRFASFDRKFIKQASGTAGPEPIEP